MIRLGGLVDLKPITEADVFTATSKETGTTSVFKSKDARDAAIKAGTHEKRKGDKDGAVKDPTDKPKVNIFDKPKKDKSTSKSSKSFSDSDIDGALEDSTQLEDFLDDNKSKFSKEDFLTLKDYKTYIQQLEGDIVDAEMDDDKEQQEKYESELEGEISKVKDILDKYKTTPSKKDTSQKSNTSNDDVKNFLSNKGEHDIIDFRKLGNSMKNQFTPKQEKQYNNLVNALAKANYDEDESDIKNAKDELYDFITGTEEPKKNETKSTTMKLKDLLPENIINEGTRSQVGIIDRSGKIQSGYVHFDGYPSNMKPGIKKHMKNEKDVLKLIKSGGARGIFADKPVEFYNEKPSPIKGDVKDIAKYIKKSGMAGGAEYVYLYDMRDRKWYFAASGEKALKKLY